ncbi:excinuclease ABC subunit UvrA [Gemelliphila asaccharolytica]|uniref:UvrABC system protein A n=1 Tax=Gemelliphila asaccharolytica TaxID=502393 RepID=A0ABR5TMU5_9BACL|nr:excinuclease ABC subunit UvrA [Gemella asaccharolytica]KXB58662.1 excinuclease ABC, A subunit [Gemella asaccharolytica]
MNKNDKIIIKGANENNLKNINLEIPKNKFVVITGVSGSGKTSLAFDTIYSEGQRRYIESINTYARQFLGNIKKPNVDYIEGLSPSIAISQKTTSQNPRSIIATITEIYDYLRLLYARIGKIYCPIHNELIQSTSISEIVDRIYNYPEKNKIMIIAPIVKNKKGSHKIILEKLKKTGYVRFKIDNVIYDVEDIHELEKNKFHSISVIVDRLIIKKNIKERIADSVESALNLSNNATVEIQDVTSNKEFTYSTKNSCIYCGFSLVNLEPSIFSFNSPQGACSMCNGLGINEMIDIDKIINQNLSINEGAISIFENSTSPFYPNLIKSVCEKFNIDRNIPFKNLPDSKKQILIYGNNETTIKHIYENNEGKIINKDKYFSGLEKIVLKRYKQGMTKSIREAMKKYIKEDKCRHCDGKRLKKEILSVYIGGKNIMDFCSMTINNSYSFINNLKLSEKEYNISKLILLEISSRIKFLNDVGLGYLTLDRESGTLSGGEAQRIRLATQIGSKLTGITYVLDEPSIGLHQRDNNKLINTIKSMRDLGNSIIVVEHDEETILSSDYIIDIGPKAGVNGGKVIAEGTPEEIIKNKKSLTGDYLSGRKKILVPKNRRKGNGKFIEIIGAKKNNLKNISLKIPLGKFIAITGVSGSGKSTLINEILFKQSMNKINNKKIDTNSLKSIEGVIENIDRVIQIDQKPIGRTPRSNPATYISVFDDIRELYSITNEAKLRGYKKGRFSFNIKGGRCESCCGDGIIKIEMHFLPDVYVLCDKCNGKRYNNETLEIKYKDKNISEILDMTVKDAYNFFINIPKISKKLKTMIDVGLEYIKLGQSSTTLSGGEAQRVKLASELHKKSEGKTLYILDEPTTGLHMDDIKKLLSILNLLADLGNTIVIIEHNLDVIKSADYVIDLGPEGGELGGNIITKGEPEEIISCEKSYTGKYLKKLL